MTMTAFYGVATQSLGVSEGDVSFIVISDGEQTKFIIPESTSDYFRKELLNALWVRLDRMPPTKDPENILMSTSYNFPIIMELSDPFPTFDDAMKDAQGYMTAYDPYAENPLTPVEAEKVVSSA